MSEFRDYLNEQLLDPEVKREYDFLEIVYFIKQAVISAKKMKGSFESIDHSAYSIK